MNYKITLFLILLSATVISAYGQENRICPLGSYLGKDTFGSQACLDSHTNQVVSSPNIVQYSHSSSRSKSTSLPIQSTPQPTQSPPQSVSDQNTNQQTQNQSIPYDPTYATSGLIVLIIMVIVYFAYKKTRQISAEKFQRKKQETNQREEYERQQREEYERQQREEYQRQQNDKNNYSRQENQKQSGSRRKESGGYSDSIKTYYTILGLEPGASKEQVKERYRELSKMVHPDKNQGSNTSTDIMKKYNEAYHAIMDEMR